MTKANNKEIITTQPAGQTKSVKQQHCCIHEPDLELSQTLEQMRGLSRLPLGQDADRDAKIKRAWSRGA